MIDSEPVTRRISVAEFCAEFFISKGTTTAFAVAGGASLHLMHAFEKTQGSELVVLHHEQSVAMAVDAYSRSSGQIGLGFATSGPGATNLVTGIAGAFYDSVGCVFLTGQVSTFRGAGTTGVRQYGFQETPILDIVRPVTKGAFAINSSGEIAATLASAYELASRGRPGPVVVEIPDNLQREFLEMPIEGSRAAEKQDLPSPKAATVEKVVRLISGASRPVLVAGAGIRGNRAIKEFRSFVKQTGFPVALTWGAAALLPSNDPNFVGFFGTHGSRAANVILRDADFVLSVGSRLDTKATGSPPATFAADAVKVMVDIDPAEIHKFKTFGLNLSLGCRSDAGLFFAELNRRVQRLRLDEWRATIRRVVGLCVSIEEKLRSGPGINPYDFLSALSTAAPETLDVWVDTGCVLPYTMTSFEVRRNTRIFHDFNNTAMGWSVSAAIGGYFADKKRQGLTLVGDGSLMMGLHDLSTLANTVPSAKVLLLDNSGYAMIRQTQDQWLGSNYVGSSTRSGLHFPKWRDLAAATGFRYLNATDPEDISTAVSQFWAADGPIFLRVQISEDWRVIPQVQFGYPNHFMTPPPPSEYLAELGL